MTLDQLLNDARRGWWDTQAQAARRLTLVLVEGEDDAEVLSELFKSRRGTWANDIRLVPCGGRDKVLSCLSAGHLPFQAGGPAPFLALVDRDTWTDAERQEAIDAHGGKLLVTEGWCIENDLFHAAALNTLVADDDVRAQMENVMADAKLGWLAVGVLWRTLQRRRDAMNDVMAALRKELTHPVEGLDLSDEAALVVRFTALAGLGSALEPATLAREVSEAWRTWQREDAASQWRRGVPGKLAYRGLIAPTLTRLLQPPRPADWRLELAPSLRARAPYDALCAMLGL